MVMRSSYPGPIAREYVPLLAWHPPFPGDRRVNLGSRSGMPILRRHAAACPSATRPNNFILSTPYYRSYYLAILVQRKYHKPKGVNWRETFRCLFLRLDCYFYHLLLRGLRFYWKGNRRR